MQIPYYAVIFTSVQTDDVGGYAEMAQKMADMARLQPGFLGIESARNEIGITVSYWKDLESIRNWKTNLDHIMAQRKGISTWYQNYTVRIAVVEREYSFKK